jgi:DNA-3-methyladenine glycosylase I
VNGAEAGPDGKPRCPWALGTPDYIDYHDSEWGRPLHREEELFERLTLEAFQSGLSWLTILRKRENFRRAFDGFEIEKVAGYGVKEEKIEAAIANAEATRELHAAGESLDELLWSFAPDPDSRSAPKAGADIPAITPESTALSKELKRRGFVFVGPTTAYATMQAVGMVNDHLEGCAFR